jgi:hypothetical protein
VSLAAEVPGGGTIGGRQFSLDDFKLLISTLDHKPMNRVLTDNPANLAFEFLQIRLAFCVNDL